MEIDYEKAYKEALERAKRLRDSKFQTMNAKRVVEEIFPELAESEDERIRKLLVWQVHRNIEDETNDLAQSVYDGIKGHDPDLEESIEDWKKCLAYLEKQKELPPTCSGARYYFDEWIQRQGNPKFWDAFLAGIEFNKKEQRPAEYIKRNSKEWYALLSEQYDKGFWKGKAEQKLAECIPDSVKFEEGFKTGRELGFREGVESVKLAEWSDEDERKRLACIETINEVIDYERDRWEDYNPGKPYRPITKYDEQIDWLKSLHPSWKPSEEQMEALNYAIAEWDGGKKLEGLYALRTDLKKLM